MTAPFGGQLGQELTIFRSPPHEEELGDFTENTEFLPHMPQTRVVSARWGSWEFPASVGHRPRRLWNELQVRCRALDRIIKALFGMPALMHDLREEQV
jgi:hypothetical protein